MTQILPPPAHVAQTIPSSAGSPFKQLTRPRDTKLTTSGQSATGPSGQTTEQDARIAPVWPGRHAVTGEKGGKETTRSKNPASRSVPVQSMQSVAASTQGPFKPHVGVRVGVAVCVPVFVIVFVAVWVLVSVGVPVSMGVSVDVGVNKSV